MILYHGSNKTIEKPNIQYSRATVDFGKGFYLTPLYEQAQKWCAKFKRKGQDSVISAYEFDDNAFKKFKTHKFEGYTMDGHYYIASEGAQLYAFIVSRTRTISIMCFNIAMIIIAYKYCYHIFIKRLIFALSGLYILNTLWNSLESSFLIIGKIKYENGSMATDPTAYVLVLTNILLFIIVRQYYEIEKTEQTSKSKIESLACNCGLSEREKEVAELLYNGLTYIAIADELYISKLTVKRHVHNIYEKAGVTSKAQFSEIVNNTK